MNFTLIANGLHMIADGLVVDPNRAVKAAPQTNVVQHPSTPAPQTPPPATTAPVAETPAQAPAAPVAVGGPTASVDEVVALFQELEQTRGKLDMAPLFQELGIERVSAATAEQRGALVAAMKQKWGG